MFASPGVYAAETSGRYSSLPQESSLESPIGSPGNGRGNFASADAARVGGGLYGHLLDALCTLATDPAPSVARMGKAVLLLAGVQITPVMGSPGDLLSCLPAIPKQSIQSPMELALKVLCLARLQRSTGTTLCSLAGLSSRSVAATGAMRDCHPWAGTGVAERSDRVLQPRQLSAGRPGSWPVWSRPGPAAWRACRPRRPSPT